MATVTYESFVGGELAPALRGRVDLERFHTGLTLSENYVIRQHGGMRNRQGTWFVGIRGFGGPIDGVTPTSGVRLHVFIPSADQVYVLEFGQHYVRIFQNGQLVRDYGDAVVSLWTPYVEADLPMLHFTESIDVLTVACRGRAPYELRRSDSTIIGFTGFEWAFIGRTQPPDIGKPSSLSYPFIANEAPGQIRSWQYAAAGADKDGIESTPVVGTVIQSDGGAGVAPLIGRVAQGINIVTGDPVMEHYTIYKGLEGTYGYIGRIVTPPGTAPGATLFFKDYNIPPDYTDPPRTFDDSFSITSEELPAVVAQFQSRIIFANQPAEPDTFWASAISSLKDFARYVPTKDADSMRATVNSLQLDEIRHIIPAAKQLFAFTSGSEYVLGAEGPLTPTNVDARAVSNAGCGWLRPLVVGGAILFVDVAGRVREFVFDQRSEGYEPADLSMLATHLFEGRTIVDWAVENNDQTVVWCVMSDGRLLSLTYNRLQNVAAWARHYTDGSFRAVCVARESGQDNVYLAVERSFAADPSYATVEPIVQIERMLPWSSGGAFVDCAQELSEPRSDGTNPITVTTGLPPDVIPAGAPVQVDIASGTFGPDTIISGISLPPLRQIVMTHEGVAYRLLIIGVNGDAQAACQALDEIPAALSDVPVFVDWRVERKEWLSPSLRPYSSHNVAVIADGDSQGSSGVITAPNGDGRLHTNFANTIRFGRYYLAQAEGLRLPTKGRQKIGGPIRVWLNETNGLWLGESPSRMVEVKQSRLVISENHTGYFEVRAPSTWSPTDHLQWQQRKSNPCEVLAIDWEVGVGG